jgi:GntR family transcriptional regulator
MLEVTMSRTGAIDRTSPLPLWAQLRLELARRVELGEFESGFPSEMDLVAQYGLSRNTVRESLRGLRDDGVVVAGRGRRPRLGRNVEIEQPVGALYSLFDSVEATGAVQRNIVRALDLRRDPVAAGRLGLGADEPLLYLERLRFADADPLAIDHVWFPAELARPLLDVDFTRTGFYDELASRTGIRLTGGEETFRAVIPSRLERALLAITPGTAAFAIDRIGMAEQGPIEWRQTVVRGDRFTVVAAFSAGSGYRLDLGTPGAEPARP